MTNRYKGTYSASELAALQGDIVSIVSTPDGYEVEWERIGIIVTWPRNCPVAVIGDWMRLGDGRIRAEYTAEEFAMALAVMGYSVTSDDVRRELGDRFVDLTTKRSSYIREPVASKSGAAGCKPEEIAPKKWMQLVNTSAEDLL